MELGTLYRRAMRGLREEKKLYFFATSSLTVAFLCLATLLLAVVNLGSFAERWGRTHRMSVYLRDDAKAQDVERLQLVLRALPDVSQVSLLSSAEAREAFLAETVRSTDLAALPAHVFPASVEVEFTAGATDERIHEVAAQVLAFKAAVSDVDTYKAWFDRLSGLLAAGRAGALLVGTLVLVCVFAVVSNTIRLAVAGRKDEIEVLKMCGATDGFVRGPFVIEGALQGLVSAATALLVLGFGFWLAREHLNGTLVPLLGMHLRFLSPLWVALLLLTGGLAGALGSALSIRRYMSV